MPAEWEILGAAHAVLKRHGAGARLFVAERIDALDLVGDADGIAFWRKVAGRIVALEAVPEPDRRC